MLKVESRASSNIEVKNGRKCVYSANNCFYQRHIYIMTFSVRTTFLLSLINVMDFSQVFIVYTFWIKTSNTNNKMSELETESVTFPLWSSQVLSKYQNQRIPLAACLDMTHATWHPVTHGDKPAFSGAQVRWCSWGGAGGGAVKNL